LFSKDPRPAAKAHGPRVAISRPIARARPHARPRRRTARLRFRNWILAFDDEYHFSPKIADALCAVASGEVIRIHNLTSVTLSRSKFRGPSSWPPLMTTDKSAGHRRALFRIAPSLSGARRFAGRSPSAPSGLSSRACVQQVLTALAHSVVTALQRIRDIDLANVPRFLDAAYWCVAAAPALGFTEGRLVQAITDPTAMWLGSDPLRDALRTFLPPPAVWTGEATSLLSQLRAIAPRAALPSTLKGLPQMLPGIFGFRVERTRTEHARTLTITRLPDLEQEAIAGHINLPPRPT